MEEERYIDRLIKDTHELLELINPTTGIILAFDKANVFVYDSKIWRKVRDTIDSTHKQARIYGG